MSKKNTKVEIINTINQVYYSIPNAIKYNAFVESGAFDDFKSTHENMTGQSPPKELVKKFYYEKVEPKLDDIKKIGMISGVIGYVMGEVDRRIDRDWETISVSSHGRGRARRLTMSHDFGCSLGHIEDTSRRNQ